MRRYHRSIREELDRAAVYRALAERTDPERREILLGLAAAEERHARHWAAKLGTDRAEPAGRRRHRPGLRARLLIALARRVGVTPVLPLLERSERAELRTYEDGAEDAHIALDERVHARVLAGLAPAWRVRASQSLRAGVFGANDGLVSNLALVMGVVGAQVDPEIVLLTGFAGMLSGSLSMAAGEYVSVTAQRELLTGEVELEAAHLEAMEGADDHDLELLGRTLGFDDAELERVRTEGAAADVDFGPGRSSEPLPGSPLAAAAANGTVFVGGAAIPVLPFLVLDDGAAVVTALALAGVALFVVGALLSVVTGRRMWWSGLRQLLIGSGAAAATFTIGRLLGGLVL